jgi:hypothetical protein
VERARASAPADADVTPPANPVPVRENSTKPAKTPHSACPAWLPVGTWQAFIDHRRALKHPLTADAARITLRDLAKAREWGHDPVALVEAAIGNGWRGCVFPDKHFQPPAAAVPGGGGAGRRVAGNATSPPGDPRIMEWESIMANLKQPAIEGEVLHANG